MQLTVLNVMRTFITFSIREKKKNNPLNKKEKEELRKIR